MMNLYYFYVYLSTYMKLIFNPNSYTNNYNDSPCCFQCPNNTLKYYSIDKRTDKCGESCLQEKWYSLYKVFEPGLTHDNHTSYPCYSYGYTIYDTTTSHGVWPIKIAVDLYDNSVDSMLAPNTVELEIA